MHVGQERGWSRLLALPETGERGSMADFESHPGFARNLGLLRSGVSVFAICALAAATPAFAQQDSTDAPAPTTSSAGDAQSTQDTNGKPISNSTSPAKAGASKS